MSLCAAAGWELGWCDKWVGYGNGNSETFCLEKERVYFIIKFILIHWPVASGDRFISKYHLHLDMKEMVGVDKEEIVL